MEWKPATRIANPDREAKDEEKRSPADVHSISHCAGHPKPVRIRPRWSRRKTASRKPSAVRLLPQVCRAAKSECISMGRNEVSVINMPHSATLRAITRAITKS